jgi:hypothetical protein
MSNWSADSIQSRANSKNRLYGADLTSLDAARVVRTEAKDARSLNIQLCTNAVDSQPDERSKVK